MLRCQSTLSSVWFYQLIFLLTGIITTIGYQFVYYSGAAGRTTLLPVAANYYGTALAIFLPEEKSPVVISAQHPKLFSLKTSNWKFHGKILLIALFEIFGNVLSILGIINAGSGIYQVIYSSLVVFTAILARLFLNRRVSRHQWYAIFLVTFGLGLSAFEQPSSTTIKETQDRVVALGMFFTLLSTIMYSFVYIISESLLTQKNPPSPQKLQTLDGIYVTILITIYLVLYTIPNFKSLVSDEIEKNGGSWGLVILTYLILMASGFFHSWTYFKLLGTVGSVSTGILQSLRAISVFILSAQLFCTNHPHQCFTTSKAAATLIVTLGVTYFSKVTNYTTVKKEDTIEEH